MDIRIKSILLILLTFTLGIITGFFLHSILVERQFESMKRGNRPFSLSRRLDEILKLSPLQTEQINPIIKKYDEKVHETIDKNMIMGMSLMDSMSIEIQPYLSDKQKSMLEDELKHFNNPPPRPMPLDNDEDHSRNRPPQSMPIEGGNGQFNSPPPLKPMPNGNKRDYPKNRPPAPAGINGIE